MKKILLLLAGVTLISLCSPVLAQMPGPPPVLLVVREDIKPGKMPAHNRHSASFAEIFAKLQVPTHRIAMVPVAGSENEVVYVTPFASFAEMAESQNGTDKKMAAAANTGMKGELDRLDKEAADLHAGMRDMFTVIRPELSYNAGVDMAPMRYFAVTTVRVRPGQTDDYAEMMKLINAARDKAKVELHVAAFQVIAGAPATTYLLFRPMKSLAEYDLKIGTRTRDAMSEDQRKKADKLSESIAFSETSVYAFDPQMSYVPKEMAARDAAFWTRKPAPIMRRVPKKKMTAPAAEPKQQ